jgi:uncharacterized protein
MNLPRREFLRAGAAAAAIGFTASSSGEAGGTARRTAPAPAGLPADWRRLRKLDCHGHVAGAKHGRQWSPASVLVDACDRLGIERIWCSIPIAGGALVSPDVVRECNDGVIAAMRQFPDRIGGWCFVQPGNGVRALEEIDRCVDAGMQGIKLYNQYKFSAPELYPIAEKCIRHRIPVLGHSAHVTDPVRRQTQPNSSTGEDFCALAKRYPELLLIMAHINGGGDWELALRMIRDCPSVFLDTSGSGLDDRTIEMAVRLLGHRRILFGTDSTMEGGVGKILSADLTVEQRDAIFWRNFHGILQWQKS